MKELDIKKIWQTGNQVSEEYSEEKIQYIIDQAPHNIIESFVKILKREKWGNLIVLSMAVSGLFYFRFWGYGLMTLVINLLFFAYYRQLIHRLDKECVDKNVIDYLNEVYSIICQFTRHFKITLVVVTLISFSIGFFLGIDHGGDMTMLMEEVLAKRWPIIVIAIVLALAISLFGFYLMYGKKAQQIKKMICALKKDETD